jgi:hypothetical protein
MPGSYSGQEDSCGQQAASEKVDISQRSNAYGFDDEDPGKGK